MPAFDLGDAVLNLAVNSGAFDSALAGVNSKVTASFRGATVSMQTFGDTAGRQTQVATTGLFEVGRGAVVLGASLAAMSAVGFEALQTITESFGEFESAIINATAVSDIAFTNFEAGKKILGDMAVTLSRDLPFGLSETTGLLVDLGQRGFEPVAEDVSALVPIFDLATATLEGLDVATDLMGSTLRTFRLGLQDSTRVADIFTLASIKTAATLSFMRSAMAFIGPVAANANVALEEVASVLSFLADRGIRATIAAVSLRQILGSLLSPTSKAKDIFKELGLTQAEVNVEMLGVVGVMRNLREAGITTGQVFDLFQRRAAASALAMLSLDDNTGRALDSIDRFTEGLENSGGTAERVRELQMSAFEVQMQLLANQTEITTVALGERFAPTVLGLVEPIKNILLGVEEWVKANPALTETLLKVAAVGTAMAGVFGVVMLGIGALIFALPALTAGFGLFGLSLLGGAALTAGIAGTIVAVGVALLNFALDANVSAGSLGEVTEAWSEFSTGFEAANELNLTMEEVAEHFTGLKRTGAELAIKLREVKESWFEFVAGFEEETLQRAEEGSVGFSVVWDAVQVSLGGVWDLVTTGFGKLVGVLGQELPDGPVIQFPKTWEESGGLLASIWAEAKKGWLDMVLIFATSEDDFLEHTKNMTEEETALWRGARNTWHGIWDGIVGVFEIDFEQKFLDGMERVRQATIAFVQFMEEAFFFLGRLIGTGFNFFVDVLLLPTDLVRRALGFSERGDVFTGLDGGDNKSGAAGGGLAAKSFAVAGAGAGGGGGMVFAPTFIVERLEVKDREHAAAFAGDLFKLQEQELRAKGLR